MSTTKEGGSKFAPPPGQSAYVTARLTYYLEIHGVIQLLVLRPKRVTETVFVSGAASQNRNGHRELTKLISAARIQAAGRGIMQLTLSLLYAALLSTSPGAFAINNSTPVLLQALEKSSHRTDCKGGFLDRELNASNSIEFKIKEALADIEYYVARVRATEILIDNEKIAIRFHQLRTTRIERLVEKGAASQEELDEIHLQTEQHVANLKLIDAILAGRAAEVKAAEARLRQLQGS